MKELKIKTLDELLHKDKLSVGDIKRLIDGNGVCFIDAYEEWKAAPKDQPGSEGPIQAAQYALREFAQIRRADADPQLIDDYYRKPDSQPICFYGFEQDASGNLFVERTPVQNQEDLIEQLTTDLANARREAENLKAQLREISTWTGFDDVDKELIPEELDIALQIYMSGIKAYDPNTGRMNNDQPIKKWLAHKVNDFFDGDPSAALCERIATVANWQKGGGRPEKNNK